MTIIHDCKMNAIVAMAFLLFFFSLTLASINTDTISKLVFGILVMATMLSTMVFIHFNSKISRLKEISV